MAGWIAARSVLCWASDGWGSPAMQHVLGLDHVVILVRDLAAAEARLERLGFRPTPRGVHSAHMGTANTTAVFADGTYLEALASSARPRTTSPSAPCWRSAGRALWPRLQDRGCRCRGSRVRGSRHRSGHGARVRPPGRSAVRAARPRSVARTDPTHTPGAGCSCASIAPPRRPGGRRYLEQPNGACGVAEVIGLAPDPDDVARAYERIFGARGPRSRRRPDRCRQGGDCLLATRGLRPALCAVRRCDRRCRAPSRRPEPADRTAPKDAGAAQRPGVRHLATAHGTLLVPPDEAARSWSSRHLLDFPGLGYGHGAPLRSMRGGRCGSTTTGSSAAYRVRIALNIKGLTYEQVAVDLRAGAQRAPSSSRSTPGPRAGARGRRRPPHAVAADPELSGGALSGAGAAAEGRVRPGHVARHRRRDRLRDPPAQQPAGAAVPRAIRARRGPASGLVSPLDGGGPWPIEAMLARSAGAFCVAIRQASPTSAWCRRCTTPGATSAISRPTRPSGASTSAAGRSRRSPRPRRSASPTPSPEQHKRKERSRGFNQV